jgi:hypothetical protein
VVLGPPRGIRNGGTRFCPNRGDPSSGLGPTSEFELSFPAPNKTDIDACALTRFSTPSRNPSGESHHSWALPAQVMLRPCTYHVLRRFAPSLDSLVSFQPGALTGCTLQSFTGQRSRRLSAKLPLLRLAIRPPKQTLGLLTSFCLRTAARLAVRRTCSSNEPTNWPVPLRLMVLKRFRRRGIAATAASLQGFDPFAD